MIILEMFNYKKIITYQQIESKLEIYDSKFLVHYLDPLLNISLIVPNVPVKIYLMEDYVKAKYELNNNFSYHKTNVNTYTENYDIAFDFCGYGYRFMIEERIVKTLMTYRNLSLDCLVFTVKK